MMGAQLGRREPSRRGRPATHPVAVKYRETPAVHAAIESLAEQQGLNFSEAQRIVNRAGLSVLLPVEG